MNTYAVDVLLRWVTASRTAGFRILGRLRMPSEMCKNKGRMSGKFSREAISSLETLHERAERRRYTRR